MTTDFKVTYYTSFVNFVSLSGGFYVEKPLYYVLSCPFPLFLFPVQWICRGALSPGLKQPGHEADCSSPANVKAKNG
jgi:hypothetical protein